MRLVGRELMSLGSSPLYLVAREEAEMMGGRTVRALPSGGRYEAGRNGEGKGT